MKMKEIKKRAKEEVENLEMPESIRTPGRTWTRYPEAEKIKNREDLDPEIEIEGDAKVLTGEEAAEKAGEKLFNAIKVEENKLTALHAAYLNSLIYIKAGSEADIEITYNSSSSILAHLVLESEESSEINLKEEFRGKAKLQTSFNEFYLGKNSNLNYGVVESFEADLSYSRRKAVLERDAKINWLNGVFESQLNRTKIETILKGDNSEVEKTGVWYPTGDQHFDLSLHVHHIGENTKCDMDSRAVVDESSRSVYEGLQQVRESAENTKSFQDEEVLMLSQDSEVDASPKLMIENPEVEASHAAAAGNLPEKELHYLESRGLNEEKARNLIVKGYFEPVMSQIKLPDLKSTIRSEVAKKLEE